MRRRLLFLPLLFSGCLLCAQDLSGVHELKQLWKYDEAIANLTQMMAEQGPKPVFLEELADCHYQSGNYAEALDQYSLLSSLQPDKILYKLRMMSLLYRGRQYAGVIDFGRDVLQRDSIPQVATMVGDAFNQLERRDSAEWYYRRVLARKAHNAPVLNKLSSILLGQERYGEVRVLAEEFLAEEPDNLTVLPIAGIANFSEARYPEARTYFKRMRELEDDSYAVHYYLGKCAQKCDDPREAEEEFILAWERDSTEVGVALTIARLMADRKAPGWEKWYEKAIDKLNPSPELIANLASAHQGYAYSAFRNELFDRCIEQYKLVLEFNPKYYASFYMIAQCYEYKYAYKEALAWYKKGQSVYVKGTRGREICDTGAARVQAEIFMLAD